MGITRSNLHKKRPSGGKKHIHRKKRKHELGRPPAMTKLMGGHIRVRRVRCRGGNYKFRALRLDAGNFSWGSETISRKARILDVLYNHTNNDLVRTKTLVKGTIVAIDAAPFRSWYRKWYGVTLGDGVWHKLVKPGKKSLQMKKDKKAAKLKEQEAAAKAKAGKSSKTSKTKDAAKVAKGDKKAASTKSADKKASKTTAKTPETPVKPVKKLKKKKFCKKDLLNGHKGGKNRPQFKGKKGSKKENKLRTPFKQHKKVSKTKKHNWHVRSKTRNLPRYMKQQILTGKILAKISSRPGQVGRADGYLLEGKELRFYLKKLEKKKKK
eukprot:NODE_2655_length_1125_cov_1986.520040_g2533_i0.p1 GENE.NODE_2655_length_1125_cov_1986.520040_g2533_i0~~NODE_2655_length_1125_cov_1986.520040_g2533_i0.p1  ORF type:complete len:324 (+),score=51.72 NODE_2655_length_1125_cov_1986.520040_g2533_i0:77-1048(+)